ncbi:MAG TPA: glycosyltransferase family 1 protein, partial [Candidatus Limnocylindrales bacterium]|nr:glycosyltransferase family 1 protein [Candidatus Limnocylindrales bacterium]
MRIGVNGWRIHGQRMGVGRYLLNVVRHWTPDAVSGRVEAIRFYTPQPLDRHVVDVPSTIHERVLSSRARMLVWENVRLGPVADDDVLFCPSYTRPLVTRPRTVVATHDANLHMFPELFPSTWRAVHHWLYGWSARNATLVVTLSEASRDDVVRGYGVLPAKVRVIPLAPAEGFAPVRDEARLTEARARLVGSNAPFFLFVGQLSGRRRIPVLIEAFAEVRRRGLTDHALVIVGLDPHNVGVPALAAAASVGPHVVHHPYLSDDDLNCLYNSAEAYVMPSVYEPGASLPVLE